MAPPTYKPRGGSSLSPIANKKRREVKVPVPKTESIIFIGSELWYNSFWLKTMFIAAASVGARSLLRACDRKVIAYVDRGYTRLEKLAIESIANEGGFTIVRIDSTQSFLALMNREREDYKLRDVVFFCHGVPGKIELNYQGSPAVRWGKNNLTLVNDRAFAADARVHSYACRTGVNVDSESFASEADAQPEESLAAQMARWFRIDVHAFLMRTSYGKVLREPSQSQAIITAMNTLRSGGANEVLNLTDEHEALPHSHLARWEPFMDLLRGRTPGAAWREGTVDYALWRKQGGRVLPSTANTPGGLPSGMRVFTPQD